MSKFILIFTYIILALLVVFSLGNFLLKQKYVPSSQNTNVKSATSSLESKNASSSVLTKKSLIPQTKKEPIKANVNEEIPNMQGEIMAWIYPGNTTCSAASEYKDGRKIDILKPEYFSIKDGATLELLTVENSGCNGYSLSNINDLKKYSKEQYVTVSSSDAQNMNTFLSRVVDDHTDLNRLIAFVVDNNISGVEIDFEDFGGWNEPIYDNYKKFITLLGDKLHSENKKLMIDIPATSNVIEKNWYIFRYSDFAKLPVDRIVVMTYDYQYDQGVGQPVAPILWIENTVKFALSELSDKSKLSFGLPSYGYKGIIGTQKFNLLTFSQIREEPGFGNAKRDPLSYEMTWQDGSTVYFYQDSISMTKKFEVLKKAGIDSVSVWHLGNNLWFGENQ